MNGPIRPFKAGDIPQIHAIEKESFTFPWTMPLFLSELVSRGFNRSLVMEDEATGKIVGYCFFWVIQDDEIHINNIATHPSHRRQGIAEALLNESIQVGLKDRANRVLLEVRESNTAALAFYAKREFKEIARRKAYYDKPKEDAVILQLELNPKTAKQD